MGSDTYKVYFARELFSLKHLAGNALLTEAINRLSDGSFSCILPAVLEHGDAPAVEIRNLDLLTLISSDLAVFNFDGTEIDSGTIVEYLFTKFIDMPTVIVRNNFRKSGEHDSDPWNLMLSSYPRT
ncbi:MAG: hypothetical protein IT292_02080 [Deltaproteobacteria bacterium]|nr:hypothetical protein [Deltaproteobacteria bacterium]